MNPVTGRVSNEAYAKRQSSTDRRCEHGARQGGEESENQNQQDVPPGPGSGPIDARKPYRRPRSASMSPFRPPHRRIFFVPGTPLKS